MRYRQVLYRYTGYRQTQLQYKATRRPQLWRRDTVEFGLDVILSFTTLGVRSAHFLWLVFLLAALAGIVWTVVRSVASDSLPPGWMDIGILLALAFGGGFMLLGFILEYLARILAEVRKPPALHAGQGPGPGRDPDRDGPGTGRRARRGPRPRARG